MNSLQVAITSLKTTIKWLRPAKGEGPGLCCCLLGPKNWSVEAASTLSHLLQCIFQFPKPPESKLYPVKQWFSLLMMNKIKTARMQNSFVIHRCWNSRTGILDLVVDDVHHYQWCFCFLVLSVEVKWFSYLDSVFWLVHAYWNNRWAIHLKLLFAYAAIFLLAHETETTRFLSVCIADLERWKGYSSCFDMLR